MTRAPPAYHPSHAISRKRLDRLSTNLVCRVTDPRQMFCTSQICIATTHAHNIIFAVCRKTTWSIEPILGILTQESREHRIPRAAAMYLAVIRPLTHLNSLPRITFQDTDGERFGDRPKLLVTV